MYLYSFLNISILSSTKHGHFNSVDLEMFTTNILIQGLLDVRGFHICQAPKSVNSKIWRTLKIKAPPSPPAYCPPCEPVHSHPLTEI